jgi:hypothetical protein
VTVRLGSTNVTTRLPTAKGGPAGAGGVDRVVVALVVVDETVDTIVDAAALVVGGDVAVLGGASVRAAAAFDRA